MKNIKRRSFIKNTSIITGGLVLPSFSLKKNKIDYSKKLKIAVVGCGGRGTGAAVADIDGDGILELLISHGESGAQPLSLFKANVSNTNFIRIKPLNTFGAPARGATVTLHTNLRNHAKTIDAGSGYLCQMEPVAHYGLREGEIIKNITIKWTNGTIASYEINDINNTFEFKQGI